MWEDKKLVNDLNHDGMGVLCERKILAKLKRKARFASMCFVPKTS